MSDIHQEWHELRKKNGDFICHLDGEMDKLEKKQVELKRREQMQDLTDAGAFAVQFVAPLPFNCCQDDRDILKALNKAQADRIKHLEDEILAYKKQQDVDMAIKKDLDKKLDKATASYRALWVENKDLKRQLDAAQKEVDDFTVMYDKAHAEAHQAKVAKDRMGYSNRCMQSKIAKQSNEIKRLIEENSATKTAYKFLKLALSTSAKDAEGNFDRGYHKGMDELWAAIRKVQDERPSVLTDIYGHGCMYDCVSNLSAQDFAKKTMEWEDKQATDIQIGDEVEILDIFCPDDDPHSDIGIVVAIDKDNPCFTVIGPRFEGCFDETDIQNGNVRKTGQHFDSIPLDYFA